MHNRLNINMLMVALAAIAVIGCETTTEPTEPTLPSPLAPTALAAKSNNETSIGLKWTRSGADTVKQTSFLIEYNAVGSMTKLTLPVTDTAARTVTITGLTEGTIYEFVVYALNDTVKSPASPKVQWAPARRGENVPPYRLYSSASSSQGSGLGIFRAVGAPSVLTISSGGEWDLCFDDKESGNPKIGSPGQSNYVDANYAFPNGQVAKTVYFSDAVYVNASSLDDIYESEALTLPGSNGEKMFPINALPDSESGIAFVMGTRDETTKKYNFAKVLLKKQATGGYIQGSGASSYVEVQISYQTVNDVPYAVKAKFDQLLQSARTTPRKPAGE
ncbi:MAG: fibronectin type III domain-containing protein [Candidatus Kapabacteria bacterium]|nr:fibronectin type III domain-containing protein [Candidatus Kapabacteria bacterium]